MTATRLPRPTELTPGSWAGCAAALRRGWSAAAGLPLTAVLDALDEVAHRGLDPAHSLRQEAERALPAAGGLSPEMARFALDHAFQPLRAAALRRRIRAEFGSVAAFERIVGSFGTTAGAGPNGASADRARAAELALVVGAGNVPVATLPTLVDLVLLRRSVVCRPAHADPIVPALLVALLAEVEPRLAHTVLLAHWNRDDDEMWRTAFAGADTIVLYGGARMLAHLTPLARAAGPARETHILCYGPRLSAAHVGRAALADQRRARHAAAALARDVAYYDQHGCLSPQMAFVERGGRVSPATFAGMLAAALASLERRLPAGLISPEAAAATMRVRSRAEFARPARHGAATAPRRGARTCEAGQSLWTPPGGALHWTVTLEQASQPGTALPEGRHSQDGGDPPSPPPLPLSPGHRTIALYPVDGLRASLRLLHPYRSWLSTLGLAPAPGRWPQSIRPHIREMGISRICQIGRMQLPPPDWPHDGRPNLRPLLECPFP